MSITDTPAMDINHNQQNTAAGAQVAYDNEKKSEGIAYALWWFTGVLGGHRFYAGDTGMAVGMLFTLGGLGVWAFIDVFFIGKRVKSHNREAWLKIANKYGIPA